MTENSIITNSKSSYRNISFLKSILEKEYNNDNLKDKINKYFSLISSYCIEISEFESIINDEYFTTNSFEKLHNDNEKIFRFFIKENYENSYLNPDFSVNCFGKDLGLLLSYYYQEQWNLIRSCFTHNIESINNFTDTVIKLYKANNSSENSFENFKNIIIENKIKNYYKFQKELFFDKYNTENKSFLDIVKTSDLNDSRYLFRYGKFITDNEIKTVEFFKNYPDSKIEKLAETLWKAFNVGYLIGNKDISKKSKIGLVYNLGQEKIMKYLINVVEKNNFDVYYNFASTTSINKQLNFDHRFDSSFWLEESNCSYFSDVYKKLTEEFSPHLNKIAGDIAIINFGEKPFKPKNPKYSTKLNAEQQKLFQKFQFERTQAMLKFKPRSETSFTAIPFPTPEIGDNFNDIFRDTMRINLIDTDHHEEIQQKIIEVLDIAKSVRVKGCCGNKTDITVILPEIDNETQTNFVNAGADINIPVGEVFTSPVLKGTNGILHIKETFLNGLKFENLILKFKDGYIEEYSCTNFKKKDENLKYVENNLLFPHKTMPIGEFAIGTNTLAYVISKKYKILDVLHPLIIEKMGPHFAIGDTCFFMSEDSKIFNRFNNKEMTARENETSSLRKEDINKAYFFSHTDITLPYEEIDYISAISDSGIEYPIIKNGRFVVEGTEELNIPFEELR